MTNYNPDIAIHVLTLTIINCFGKMKPFVFITKRYVSLIGKVISKYQEECYMELRM
jgi:hypothetical protein